MTCPHKNILTELTLREKNPRAIFLSTQLPDRSLIQTTAGNFHYLIQTVSHAAPVGGIICKSTTSNRREHPI